MSSACCSCVKCSFQWVKVWGKCPLLCISLLHFCQCCSKNAIGNFCPLPFNSGDNCVFICSTVTINEIKEHLFSFAFYLSAPKRITTALSSVWQAYRYSQAVTVEVNVWEQCYKHNLKFSLCFFCHRHELSSPLSSTLSLSVFLPCAHSLPVSHLHFFLTPLFNFFFFRLSCSLQLSVCRRSRRTL